MHSFLAMVLQQLANYLQTMSGLEPMQVPSTCSCADSLPIRKSSSKPAVSRESQAPYDLGRSVFEGSRTTQQQQCTASDLVARHGQRQRATDRPVHPHEMCYLGEYITELDRSVPPRPGSSVEEEGLYHANRFTVRHCQGREGHDSAQHISADEPRQAQEDDVNELGSEPNRSRSV